ncbi:RNase H domain protein [Fusarium tjaetaba]|uniref:RNase H domain protein n=1 Tax=Fusarium tjaetaba TaxID=1567544 RepID=A0A8H5W787_9HYPO|nr:RNase H domain protein [Fusarium tjaetaba]KAF5649501.1 RNase H domain protein [Fusarium tjaetaba]
MSTKARRPKVFAYATFDLDALISLASKLRGQSCTVDTSTRPKAGSTHWVIFITFEDGVEWVFRSPRRGLSAIITEESASKLLTSEAVTLKYLRTLGSMPVPEVFSFSGDGDNDIGVPYILMSKASGRTLSDYDWIELSQIQGYPNRRPLLPTTDRDREKHRDELVGIDRGPFDRESQYLRSLISALTTHAEELSLTPHSFFAPIPGPFEYPNWTSYQKAVDRWQHFCSIDDKVEGNKNRLDFCISGQFLDEIIPHLVTTEERFVLCHPDLHRGNIFVDEDFNITCIIDWSSASASPTSELLSTPGLNGSLSPPKPSLIAAFRAGFRDGDQVLRPQQWARADKMWYFLRLVRMLSTQDYTLFKSLYDLVYNENSDDIPRQFHERSMQDSGRALFAKLCQEGESGEGDEPTQEEDANGQTTVSVEAVIARKLTLMSELNTNFVADKRLWLWIENVLETPDV